MVNGWVKIGVEDDVVKNGVVGGCMEVEGAKSSELGRGVSDGNENDVEVSVKAEEVVTKFC